MMISRVTEFLISPLRADGRINKPLVLIFVLINGIVLFNAVFHDPAVGYDATGHAKYIAVLSEFRLPNQQNTREFFSPPLPYLLPSLLYASGVFDIWDVAKFAQLLNAFFSLGLTLYLVKICDLVRPNNSHLKATSLLLMGMLPVYYKTFSFVRGEPLLAFLSTLALYEALGVFVTKMGNLRRVVILGLWLGLLILARQWGFCMFPAIVLFAGILIVKRRQQRSYLLGALALSFAIACLTGSWFYLHLYKSYGSVSTFNRSPRTRFSFSNQPLEFYFGFGLEKVFSDPIQLSFRNQFFPVFYSETWGDYWGYFVVYGKDIRNGQFVVRLDRELAKRPLPWWLQTNRYSIAGYLGRVNLVSLLPSAVLLSGVAMGMVYFGQFVKAHFADDRIIICSLLYLVIVTAFVGYSWFLIMYPDRRGDTIKATYLLHVFPFVCILAGEVLERAREKSALAYWSVVMLLVLSLLHNLPVFITRYMSWLLG